MKIELRDVNDDWVELLINGEIVLEGHDLRTSEVIKQVAPGAEFAYQQVYRCIYCEKEMADSGDDYRCGNCL